MFVLGAVVLLLSGLSTRDELCRFVDASRTPLTSEEDMSMY